MAGEFSEAGEFLNSPLRTLLEWGMARKPRIEFPGALYHVINRGNYRWDVFSSEGAKAAFEKCLIETCAMTGWRIHAYAIMRNHFHLAVETPRANLVKGMQWLQSTFASRFNRFRKVNGHLFQGRYKSIMIEPGPVLGYVVNYIHLNPIRAGVVTLENLRKYPWTSYHRFRQRNRPAFLACENWLFELGGLQDTPGGWRSYESYLTWLAQNDSAQTAQNFENLCHGWALGSNDWRESILEKFDEVIDQAKLCGIEVADLKEAHWKRTLSELLRKAGRTRPEIRRHKKSAKWKAEIAFQLRQSTTATNRWIARALHMGKVSSVSVYISWFRQNPGKSLNISGPTP